MLYALSKVIMYSRHTTVQVERSNGILTVQTSLVVVYSLFVLIAIMVEAALLNQGWHLSKEGLERCKKDALDSRVESVVRKAMDIDLRHIGVASLPTDINKGKTDKMQGPMVLQVQKTRNISAPKANEDSGVAPPLIRVQLTDGHTTIMALVLNSISKIDLSTPPGIKLKLTGSVAFNHGFLLLMSNNCTFLGGHVEELVQRWELAKSLYHHTRAAVGGSGGPPPWVPFEQRNRDKEPSQKPAKITMKKSLEDPKSKEQTEQDKEFVEQRKAAIQEVNKSKPGQGKTFGGTKATPAMNAREPGRRGFENNRRDGGRNARREEVVPTAGKNRTEGIYRDLDYGGYQPSERDIQQLVNMGFKRDAASNALRKHTGNADAAVEMLVTETGSSQPQEQNVGRQRPGTRPEHNRGNERRGRRRDEEDEASAPLTGPATLFDFLQPKLGKDKEVAFKKDTGSLRDFSREQPSSVREAGISFVHDGQTPNYRHREQQQGRQQKDNNMDRSRRNYEQKTGFGRPETNSARNYAGNEGRGRYPDRGYGNKENSNFRDRNPTQDRYQDTKQGNSYPQRRDDTRSENQQYNESRGKEKSKAFQNDANFTRKDFQDNRPPRFQKQNNSQRDKVPYDRPKSNTDSAGNRPGGNQFQSAQSVDSSGGYKGPSVQQRPNLTDSEGNRPSGNQFQPVQSVDSSGGYKGPSVQHCPNLTDSAENRPGGNQFQSAQSVDSSGGYKGPSVQQRPNLTDSEGNRPGGNQFQPAQSVDSSCGYKGQSVQQRPNLTDGNRPGGNQFHPAQSVDSSGGYKGPSVQQRPNLTDSAGNRPGGNQFQPAQSVDSSGGYKGPSVQQRPNLTDRNRPGGNQFQPAQSVDSSGGYKGPSVQQRPNLTDSEGNRPGGNQFQPAQSVDSSGGYKGPSVQQRPNLTDSEGNRPGGNQFQPAQSVDSSGGYKGPSVQQRPNLTDGNRPGGNQFQPAQSVDSSGGYKGPSVQQRPNLPGGNQFQPAQSVVSSGGYKGQSVQQRPNLPGGNQFQPAQSVDSSGGYKGQSVQQRPNLNAGDQCLAKYWEDNQFYTATLTAIHPSGKTCVVLFPDYGNHEEVKITDIRPLNSLALTKPSSVPPGPTVPSLLKSGNGGLFEGSIATHLEFRQGGEGTAYNRPRQQQEQRKNIRPAQNLYQPPSSRK